MKMFASSAGVPTIEIMSETELDSFSGSEERRLVLCENIHAWDSLRSTTTLPIGKSHWIP